MPSPFQKKILKYTPILFLAFMFFFGVKDTSAAVLSLSCSVSPVSTSTGTMVTWGAGASGGTSPYSYSWTGDDSLVGVPSTTTARELSGQNTYATLVNGVATTTSGAIGEALTLDGVNDYVNIGDPSSGVYDFGTGSFSYGAWFKTGNATSRMIMSKTTVGQIGYDLLVSAGGNVQAKIVDAGAAHYAQTPIWSGVNDDSWHHVFVVVNRSAQTITLYGDGAQKGTPTTTASVGSVSSTYPLQIGARNGSLFFSGGLDEVRMYNRALSSGEVSALYSNTSPTATGLVGYWSFNTGDFFGSPTATKSYLNPGAKMGTVTVTDAISNTAQCSKTETVVALPPTSLTAVPLSCSSNTISLKWTAPNAVGVIGYRVYRDAIKIADLVGAGSLYYDDYTTSFVAGTSYSYYVTAVYIGTDSGASNTASAIAPSLCVGAVNCPLSPQAGRTIVDFSHSSINSNGTASTSQQGPYSIALPVGTYKAILVSYDDHFTEGGTQTEEQYYVDLRNATGSTIESTGSIIDLPDGQNFISSITDLVSPNQAIASLLLKHPAYQSVPSKDITPVCVAFDSVNVVNGVNSGCSLLISKSVNTATTTPGDRVSYTVNVSNTGDANCTGGVLLQDTLDPVLSGNSLDESHSNNVTSGYAPFSYSLYSIATRTLSWNLNTLIPGETASVTWSALNGEYSPNSCTPTAPYSPGPLNITNTAKVSSQENGLFTGSPVWTQSNQVTTICNARPGVMQTSCFAAPNPGVKNQNITWTSTVSGSQAPYLFRITWQEDGTWNDSGPITNSTYTTSRVYNVQGSYNAELRVTGNDGQVVTKMCSPELTISNPSPSISVDCTASPNNISVGQPTTFTATVTGAANTPIVYQWSDLSGVFKTVTTDSRTNSVIKTYTTVGNKNVDVTITTADSPSKVASCSPKVNATVQAKPNFNEI